MVKISIAMATYNGEHFIGEQLQSLADQSRLPDELVVCDDRSTDETVKILRAFSTTAPFEVRVYENEKRLGFVGNFARAISETKGDIIFLSDQDDVWYREKLETIVFCYKTSSLPWMVVNNADLAYENGDLVGHTVFSQFRRAGLQPIIGCCTSFREPLKDLLLPVCDVPGIDGWLYDLVRTFEKVTFLQTPLQLYRRHQSNTSNGMTAKLSRVTLVDLYRRRSSADSVAACDQRLHKLELVHGRITELLTAGDDFKNGLFASSVDIRVSLRNIGCERKALERRIKALSLGRLERAFCIMLNYIKGDYQYFSGFKSLLKDFML